MSDLIKREDAIKALRCEYPTMPMFKGLREEWAIKTEGFRKAEEVIMMLPSADRPQGWIPCSERLPSEQGQYLVTTYACDDYYYVDILSFHKGEFYSTDSEWGDMVDNDVVAWMPLPKPWKGAEDEI